MRVREAGRRASCIETSVLSGDRATFPYIDIITSNTYTIYRVYSIHCIHVYAVMYTTIRHKILEIEARDRKELRITVGEAAGDEHVTGQRQLEAASDGKAVHGTDHGPREGLDLDSWVLPPEVYTILTGNMVINR